MEKAFVFNRGYSAKSRSNSALSRKSGGIGGYGQKSQRVKDTSIIQQNILAVKNFNTQNLGDHSNAGDITAYTRADADLSDTMIQVGAKFGNESVSDSNVGTNYTKGRMNYAGPLAESHDASGERKKTKRSKKLPKIFDDSRVTPKAQRMQYSTDFGPGKRNKGVYNNGGIHQGGYETENVVSPDHMRNNHFQFGSTNDSGFDVSHTDIGQDNFAGAGGAKAKRKKYTYMTIKTSKDNKSKSVSSNLGRMDHTCFI